MQWNVYGIFFGTEEVLTNSLIYIFWLIANTIKTSQWHDNNIKIGFETLDLRNDVIYRRPLILSKFNQKRFVVNLPLSDTSANKYNDLLVGY